MSSSNNPFELFGDSGESEIAKLARTAMVIELSSAMTRSIAELCSGIKGGDTLAVDIATEAVVATLFNLAMQRGKDPASMMVGWADWFVDKKVASTIKIFSEFERIQEAKGAASKMAAEISKEIASVFSAQGKE